MKSKLGFSEWNRISIPSYRKNRSRRSSILIPSDFGKNEKNRFHSIFTYRMLNNGWVGILNYSGKGMKKSETKRTFLGRKENGPFMKKKEFTRFTKN